MPSLPLPLASAIPTIQWPLGPSSCPPLYFESIDKLKEIRTSKQSRNIDLIDTLYITLNNLGSNGNQEDDCYYFGLVSTALILIGNGFTDEAHDLVTPLSWPQDTHFGYGPSVYDRAPPDAKTFATYVHCLVHRREGFNVGEFGMVGFQNANYWSNALVQSPSFPTAFPHDDLNQQVFQLQAGYKGNAEIQDWYRRHEILSSKEKKKHWETRSVHELCANVLRNKDEKLQEFAEQVAETELRVVLSHALKHAGFKCPDNVVVTRNKDGQQSQQPSCKSGIGDVDTALKAANKVSSTHLQSFQSNGSVTNRNAMAEGDPETMATSVAAGIAARLLGVKACRRQVRRMVS